MPENEAAPTPEGLDPTVAKRMLKANLLNLGRKIQAGKTLNAQEVALLQASASGESVTQATGWAMNQVELAEALKVNRRTIARWLKVPGNPGAQSDGRMNVPAWREWAKLQGHKFKEDASPTKAALECERLLKQNRLLEIELQTRLGELTRNEDMVRWVAELVTAFKTVILSLPGILAPEVVGLTVAEAELRIRQALDEALEQLHREPWKK